MWLGIDLGKLKNKSVSTLYTSEKFSYIITSYYKTARTLVQTNGRLTAIKVYT